MINYFRFSFAERHTSYIFAKYLAVLGKLRVSSLSFRLQNIFK